MKLVVGDHFERPIQLTKDGLPFSIGPGATVRARLVHLKTGGVGEIYTLTGLEDGSNWASSLVVPIFSSAISSTWPVGRSKLEIEVVDPTGEPRTWFISDIMVLPQTIT